MFQWARFRNVVLGPVVQKLDNSIEWINGYLVDSEVCFANIYLLDSDFFPVDSAIQHSNNRVLKQMCEDQNKIQVL